MDNITEGKALLRIPSSDKISRSMEVFYNPVMKFNRDVSILLLKALGRRKMNIADPLAGSGIRAIRFLLELPKGLIKTIHINDHSENAINSINKNLTLNKYQ